jgi:RNA polymerase sigma-70 factor (ECF subfamily)
MSGGQRANQLLVELLQQLDERAWAQVFATHRDGIFGVCLRMLRNHEEAEDITQEVFLRAVMGIEQFRGDALLKTWLHKIAHNLCLTRIAAKKTSAECTSDGSGIEELESEEPDAEAASASIELREALERAIGELEPPFREAILLRVFEDLSYQEIARVTGVPENTVKTRIYRARAKLQQRLGELR